MNEHERRRTARARHLRYLLRLLSPAVAAGAVMLACGEGNPSVPTTLTSASPQTEASGATPSPQTTVPCLILPVEYCSYARLIEITDEGRGTRMLIVFKLPAGVPIFAPWDGRVFGGIELNSQPPLAAVNGRNEYQDSYTIRGDISLTALGEVSNTKKGDVLGVTQDTGASPVAGYTLTFGVSRHADPSLAGYLAALKQFFPALEFPDQQ